MRMDQCLLLSNFFLKASLNGQRVSLKRCILVSFSSIGESLNRASYSIIGHKSYNTLINNFLYLGEIL